jgi:hypothetical protein
MIRSKLRTMITLFTLAIIAGVGCASLPSGLEFDYRTTAGNAVIRQTWRMDCIFTKNDVSL